MLSSGRKAMPHGCSRPRTTVVSWNVACSEATGPCAAASIRPPHPAPVTIRAVTRVASHRPHDVLAIAFPPRRTMPRAMSWDRPPPPASPGRRPRPTGGLLAGRRLLDDLVEGTDGVAELVGAVRRLAVGLHRDHQVHGAEPDVQRPIAQRLALVEPLGAQRPHSPFGHPRRNAQGA